MAPAAWTQPWAGKVGVGHLAVTGLLRQPALDDRELALRGGVIGGPRQREVPADPMVAGRVREGDGQPDERLAGPQLDGGRDLDRGGDLAPAGAVCGQTDGPVVAADDLDRSPDRAGRGRRRHDDPPVHEAVRRRRPEVVRVAEVAAVDDPADALEVNAATVDRQRPVIGDRDPDEPVRDLALADEDAILIATSSADVVGPRRLGPPRPRAAVPAGPPRAAADRRARRSPPTSRPDRRRSRPATASRIESTSKSGGAGSSIRRISSGGARSSSRRIEWPSSE